MKSIFILIICNLFLSFSILGKEFFLKNKIEKVYPNTSFKREINLNYFQTYFELHELEPDTETFKSKLKEHNKARACLFFFSRKIDMDHINRFGNELIEKIKIKKNFKKVEERILGSMKDPVENVEDQFYDGYKACKFIADPIVVENYRRDFNLDGILKLNIDPQKKIELAFRNRPYLKQAFSNYYQAVSETNQIKEINKKTKELMLNALRSGQCLEAVSFSGDLLDLTQMLGSFKKDVGHDLIALREKFLEHIKSEKEEILKADPISFCTFPILDSDKTELRRMREEDYKTNIALYEYFVIDSEVFHPKFQSLIKSVEKKVDLTIFDHAHAAISFNQMMLMHLGMIDVIYGQILDNSPEKCTERYFEIFQDCFKKKSYELIPSDTLKKILCIDDSNAKLKRECQITYDEPEL